MDVSGCVSTEYVAHDVGTPVSKLRGTFDDQGVRVVVLTDDGEFAGVLSRAALLSSHHPPEQTAGSIATDPPRIQRSEDLRETARLMVESELKSLPVFEGEDLVGVVTAPDLLAAVRDDLDALDVEDVYTRDLFAVAADDTVGTVINRLRENKITRVPVLDDGRPRGIVSVYDIVDFVVRSSDRVQGGATGGSDGHGGAGAHDGFRSTRGTGERAGEQHRLLDLPARDVMSEPVLTTTRSEPLGASVERMLDDDVSSLVVVDDDRAVGIVTVTDALRALTWTEDERIPVQVFNVDLLDALTRDDIATRVEEIDAKYEAMDVLEVNVILHEHTERLRGVPLVLATIRLFTDEGLFSGSAEEYGAEAAFLAAADLVEENALQDKGRETDHHAQKPDGERRRDVGELLGWWATAEE